MSKYLELAKNKFKESNDVNFKLPLIDFVSDCYVRLKPCSYGVRIQQKITTDLSLTTIRPQLNIGDVLIGKTTCEVKTSFLDRKNSYHLTHLRMWQKFKYYLFCLIDCENNFTPEFYLIDKYVLNKIRLTPMNGTKESNSDNTNIELRCTIKKDSNNHKILIKENKLGGNSYSDMISYVESSLNIKLEPINTKIGSVVCVPENIIDEELIEKVYNHSFEVIKYARYKKSMNYLGKMVQYMLVQIISEEPKFTEDELFEKLYDEVRMYVITKSLKLKLKFRENY